MLKRFLASALIMWLTLIAFSSKTFAEEFELVSYSAQVKLQWLAKTGMPEAQEILERLGKVNIYGKKNLPDYDRLETVNSIYQELCYAATAEYVKRNNYANIMDIGGGYSPRAVVMARDGRKYIGAELAAVAVSATPIMHGIVGRRYAENISYAHVPVEDRDAMLDTAYKFDGKICVIEQGLMIYLTEERADAMFTLVKEMITKSKSGNWHGGCFITSDFVTKDLFKDIAAAIYGADQAQMLYDETKEMYEELFDGRINDDLFATREDAVKFLKAHKLKVKQIPLLTDTSKLYCLKNLTSEQASAVKRICAKPYLWAIVARG